MTGAYLVGGGGKGPCVCSPPLEGQKIALIFNVKNMLKFEHFWKCTCTPEMYLWSPAFSDFWIRRRVWKILWVWAAAEEWSRCGRGKRSADVTENDMRMWLLLSSWFYSLLKRVWQKAGWCSHNFFFHILGFVALDCIYAAYAWQSGKPIGPGLNDYS